MIIYIYFTNSYTLSTDSITFALRVLDVTQSSLSHTKRNYYVKNTKHFIFLTVKRKKN